MASKLQRSLAVEGELPEDGLAANENDGEDLMMALARRIVSGEGDGPGPATLPGACPQTQRPPLSESVLEPDSHALSPNGEAGRPINQWQ